MFVCLLHIRLVCGLALHRLTIPLLLLDCPASGPCPRVADGPPTIVSDQFVFALDGQAALQPQLPLPLPFCPPRPLD
jgi:hypothetical protein